MFTRKDTRRVMVGDVPVGGGAPISVQSMTTTDTTDVEATLDEILRLQDVGCDIIRVSTPSRASVAALEKIMPQTTVPIVADIHFDHSVALLVADIGIAKLRINPGNIGGPAKAECYVLGALSRKERIPGFGHAVYRTEDPRAVVLRGYAERLSERIGDTPWFEIAKEVERATSENTEVFPNVDFYSGIIYHLMGIPTELFTPLFACSRVVGWTAHILEQCSDNRLIRPRARYTGPLDLCYVPIEQRKT